MVHGVNAATIGRKIEYKNITFRSKNLKDTLDGYKIAFISDVHAASERVMQGVVKELNRRSIDLLLLGGDFSYSEMTSSTHKCEYINARLFGETSKKNDHSKLNREAIITLTGIKTTDGVYGVEGNHDNHKELFDAMKQCGMTPLSNSGMHIREGLYLAGLEDIKNRNPSIAIATAGAPKEDFILLLSHNPDVTMQQDTSNANLILCGHTHGGQVTLFGAWAPVFTVNKSITAYGQRFMSGWSKSRDGVPIYISNGVGVNHKMPRVYAQPQVIVLTLRKTV